MGPSWTGREQLVVERRGGERAAEEEGLDFTVVIGAEQRDGEEDRARHTKRDGETRERLGLLAC